MGFGKWEMGARASPYKRARVPSFVTDIGVPNVSKYSELAHILHALQVFESPEKQRKTLEELQNISGTTYLNVGIKKILMLVETARQDEDTAGSFLLGMSRAAG